MSRKRLTAIVLTVVTGLAARTVVAAPRASVAELRAITCCAEHCPMPSRRPMKPLRCCFVESAAADPATATTLRPPTAPATTLVATLAAGDLVAVGARTAAPTLVVTRAGPPVYLRSLALRL